MIQQLVSFDSNDDLKGAKAQLSGCADFVRQLRILLDCLSAHAVETDIPDHKRFQQDIGIIAESLQEDISPPDLETLIGKIVRAVEHYNNKASDSFKLQARELTNLLGLLAQTVAFIASGTETNLQQLGLIESRLKQGVMLQDPRQMRAFMEESLAVVLAESKRVQSEARAKTEALNAEIERLKDSLRSAKLAVTDDPITGLPARAAAEQAIENGINARREFAIALFMIDRLVSINGRFGRLIGDQVLVNGAVTLAGKLRGATLYRWSGPSFLAIFDPSVSASVAEANAKQAAAFRIEKEFQIRDRNALVVITCTLHFSRISSNENAASTVLALDASLVAPELAD